MPLRMSTEKGSDAQKTVFVAFCAEMDLQATVKRLGQTGKLSAKQKGCLDHL